MLSTDRLTDGQTRTAADNEKRQATRAKFLQKLKHQSSLGRVLYLVEQKKKANRVAKSCTFSRKEKKIDEKISRGLCSSCLLILLGFFLRVRELSSLPSLCGADVNGAAVKRYWSRVFLVISLKK